MNLSRSTGILFFISYRTAHHSSMVDEGKIQQTIYNEKFYCVGA